MDEKLTELLRSLGAEPEEKPAPTLEALDKRLDQLARASKASALGGLELALAGMKQEKRIKALEARVEELTIQLAATNQAMIDAKVKAVALHESHEKRFSSLESWVRSM